MKERYSKDSTLRGGNMFSLVGSYGTMCQVSLMFAYGNKSITQIQFVCDSDP